MTEEQFRNSELGFEHDCNDQPVLYRVLFWPDKLHRRLRSSNWFGSREEAEARVAFINASDYHELISLRAYRAERAT